jgi:hypothetical protein
MNISAIADAATSHSAYDLLKLLAQISPLAVIVVVVLTLAGVALARLR